MLFEFLPRKKKLHDRSLLEKREIAYSPTSLRSWKKYL